MQDRSIDLTHRGGLIFTESDHVYRNIEGEKYRSCTGILGQFKNHFDSDSMSKYKAIKDTLSEEHFILLKQKAGHWKNVKNFWGALIEKKPEYSSKLIEARDGYLNKWNNSGTTASTAGSVEHDIRENKIITEKSYCWNDNIYVYDPNITVLDIDNKSNCVIPEILLWDHSITLGGLADIAIIDNGYIHILDYKTNRTISKEGFAGNMMKLFLSHLPDASFYHYSLQLLIYQKMACKLSGLKPGECWLISTENENYNRSSDVYIRCEDLRKEVDKIFEHIRF